MYSACGNTSFDSQGALCYNKRQSMNKRGVSVRRKKILMLTTGGTVASANSGDGLLPQLQGEQLLSFCPGLQEQADVTIESVLSLDSSNMQPEHWTLLAERIVSRRGEYDGVVITHGTDTMAYTSSALSFMLRGIRIPVILTGSQSPISEPGSDAPRNLMQAFYAAMDERFAGVYVVFCGRIIKGCRASKVDTVSVDAFRSINVPEAALFAGKRICVYHLDPLPEQEGPFHLGVCPKVLLMKLIPGMDPHIIDYVAQMDIRAVVLECFGFGGVPIAMRSLIEKLHMLEEKGILSVGTTQCSGGYCNMSTYEVGRKALMQGVICAGDMTYEAIVAKLMWLCSLETDVARIQSLFLTNLCGELSEETLSEEE